MYIDRSSAQVVVLLKYLVGKLFNDYTLNGISTTGGGSSTIFFVMYY